MRPVDRRGRASVITMFQAYSLKAAGSNPIPQPNFIDVQMP
jgi:hypothetical protein